MAQPINTIISLYLKVATLQLTGFVREIVYDSNGSPVASSGKAKPLLLSYTQ